MPLFAGDKLGPYEILADIGEGGMGVVYRARDVRLDRYVAIKLLPAALATDAQARERFRREAIAAAALDHPYICKIFEIGEHASEPFMVMEWISGETLHQRLQRGKMPLPEILHVAREIAEALQEAHARRFLHRDLKPSNIMLTEHGHVKIMDFGLAKRLENLSASGEITREMDVTQLTTPGTILGTPDYMSPEQAKGLPLDEQSDLFSYGVILAEMISGRHPFRRPSTVETFSAVLREPPDIAGDVPQTLMLVVRRLLAKAPSDRFATIAAVRSELAKLTSSFEPSIDAGRRSALIGRDSEFGQLTRQLEEALGGRGSLIMVGGEPGIGKTYLTEALLDAARLRGALGVTGHCYEMEGSPPYVPFIETLEYSARTTPRDSFRHALGEEAPEVAKLMPELRLMFPDIPPPLELPPEQQRRFLFNAYRQFVERSARLTPIVALFEDLHWADEPTVLLLQHLAQSVASIPMLIIVTYRNVDLEVGRPFAKVLESLLRQKLASRILLRRLQVSGVEQMLASLSSQEPPKSLARLVFAETEGNPFFVEEVFRHLAEEGKLLDERGAFLPGLRVDQLQVPEGVRLVLGRRLERLSEDTRRILCTAAVIGRAFPLELLEEMEKSRPDAALEAMEEADRAHLVEPEAAGRQARYRFVHELVRQTLAETLSLPRRQRLHARVADALERVFQASLDAHIPALAHHLFEAGAAADQEKTIQYLSKAARRASAAAAHEEALDDLNNALSLLENEHSARVAELHTWRAAVLWSLSRVEEAIREYERALAVFETLGDHAHFVQTCVMLRQIYGWATRFDDAKTVAARAAHHAVHGPAALRSTVLSMQTATASLSCEIDLALKLLDEASKIPEAELPPDVFGLAVVSEFLVRLGAGQMQLAEAATRRATRIFEQSRDVWWQADIELGLILPPLHCGRPLDAERAIQKAVPRAVRVGHDNAKYVAMGALPSVHIAKGDLEGAEEAAREAVLFGESVNAGWIFATEAFLGGILFFRDKNPAESLTMLKRAVGSPKTFWSGFPEGLLALVMTASGAEDSADARAAAVRFLPGPGCSQSIGAWHAVICLIEAFCLCGQKKEAGRLLAEAEKIVTEWDFSLHGFPVRTAAGIAAACTGDWARAEEHHRAAIARMDAVPYVTAQPIARYWYAHMLGERHRAGDAAAATALLREAITYSEAIGLSLYSRLARQRLADRVTAVAGIE